MVPAGPPLVQNAPMANLADTLKHEIARLARRELRREVGGMRKTVSSLRAEAAALKRQVAALEKALKAADRRARADAPRGRAAADVPASADKAEGLRFRAAGMASNRKRLGLSAADFGRLVGATGQSVYAWEQGKTKPRADALAAIAALRGIGKREVMARLEAMKAGG